MHCGYRNALFITYTGDGKAINASSLKKQNMDNVERLCNVIESFLYG